MGRAGQAESVPRADWALGSADPRAGRWGLGRRGVPLAAAEAGRGAGRPAASWSTGGLALRGGRPGRWLDSRCVVKIRLVGFLLLLLFFLRHGSQAGGTVWLQSWGRLEPQG